MRKLNFSLFVLSLGLVAISVATPNAFGVETPLTNYSRAVMLDNPSFYWTFNETGTAVAQDVMRWEPESQMIAAVDATRTSGYSTELGNAFSFNDNAALWCDLVNRGDMAGAYAIEFWIKSNQSGGGYVMNFLGDPVGGDSPGVIMDFTPGYLELFSGVESTGEQTPLAINDNNWHHVVLAVYGDDNFGVTNRIDIGVDGNVSAAVGTFDSKPLNISGAVSIGACFPSTTEAPSTWTTGNQATAVWDGFNGNVDELALYDLSGLTEAEVAAKVNNIAGHYALATNPVAITEFAPVPANEVTYTHISGTAPNTGDYGDAGSDLSDGDYIEGYTLAGSVVGFQNYKGATTEYEFDLGEVRTLEAVWIDYLGSGGNWGLYAPEYALVSYSEDGSSFTTLSMFEDFNDTPESYNFCERKAQIDMGSVDAQYVRIEFANSMDSTSSTNFMFLSEVQFIEKIETPKIAGDANNDGKVDGSDVTILAGNWQYGVDGNGTASWEMGDFNGDGKVDGSDVTILAGNWQYGVNATTAAVPEPSTLLLLLTAAAGLYVIRRK